MARRPQRDRVINILEEILAIPSPSGFTGDLIRHIGKMALKNGIKAVETNKGALLVGNHPRPSLIVAGHIDTLGAMVRQIRGDGQLTFTRLGGPMLPSFEGSYVSVFTESGTIWRGTLLLNNPAAHVNRTAATEERKEENMHIRLDAEVATREDTEKLGIQVGDFIAFDPRCEVTATGFIKSHFLDDKAGSAAMIDAFLTLGAAALTKLPVCFFFSNYEEVGHGACAGLPADATEMLVVDMGVVGTAVEGDEKSVSICVKDSGGPYDYGVRQRLARLAKKAKLPYKLDVFPFYGSDGTAALHAGYNLRVGLIGPGVSASHGNERTHRSGLLATRDLILEFIKESAANK